MDPMTLDAPFDSAEQRRDLRRVSQEPLNGYVLDPWSGLYQETEAMYRERLDAEEAELA
ncbi:hypothetical protein [Dyella dinghuensis]|uniref:hypothetical protein n=1 Tax=Dyella dinghuensis TaxID=1920169 RepID=UPI0013158A02|nr:hypothetical protein [Dyella dinghuensis]